MNPVIDLESLRRIKVDVTYDVIDFPGAYSLNPMSPDEELTRNLVIDAAEQDRPDLVIIAVDASSLSRSLYMVAQLTEQENRAIPSNCSNALPILLMLVYQPNR